MKAIARLAPIIRTLAAALAAAILAAPALAGPGIPGPTFTDVTVQAGVDYVHHVRVDPPGCLLGGGGFCEPERMTGGVAIGDYDGDGLDDIFVTRIRNTNILFRNKGNGTYEDATTTAGLNLVGNFNGCAWADFDNDGDLDLYVTTLAQDRNLLFINDGSGHFTEDGQSRGAALQDMNTRIAWSVGIGDYDRDGYLDIFACEWGAEGFHARLLHNRGAAQPGYFDDVTVAAGLEMSGINSPGVLYVFSASFMDLDGDGWPDLAISGDFGTSRLFWNNHDGTFTDGTLESGVGGEENGMGSTIADWDGDGRPDWFVSSVYDPLKTCDTQPCGWGYTGNRLYRNEGNRRFTDRTSEKGVRIGFWGWGASFLDYDNDGDLDLVMTNGVIFPTTIEDAYNADPMRFWRNDGAGLMTEISQQVGITDTRSGKGLATFDFDNDGDLDIFVVNNGDHPVLYRNDGGNANGWLRIRARGTKSNRDGIGAQVRVQATAGGPIQYREINSITAYLAQSERVAHFGLGPGTDPVASVQIYWPASGETQTMTNVPRNQTLTVTEP